MEPITQIERDYLEFEEEPKTPPSSRRRFEETPTREAEVSQVVHRQLLLQTENSPPKGKWWVTDSAPTTPHSSPSRPKTEVKESPRATAVKRALRVLEENRLEDSLLSRDQTSIEEGVGFLQKRLKPFDSPKRAGYANMLQSKLVEQAGIPFNERRSLSIKDQERVTNILKDSDWALSIVFGTITAQKQCSEKTLSAHPPIFPSTLRNWGHIRKPDATGGFHFCPPTDPLYASLTRLARNSENGVTIAEFPHRKGVKRSSFFPEEIGSLEELEAILEQGRVIATGLNMELVQTMYQGKPLYVEQCVRERHPENPSIKVLSTFFPVFFYAKLDSGQKEFIIQENSYSCDTLFQILASCSEAAIMESLFKSLTPLFVT